MPDPVAAFIARWKDSSGSERANHQPFISELCDLLGVPRPSPTNTAGDNAYVFEKEVIFHEADGSTGHGRIDCYHRERFVLEAKQAKLTGAMRRGSPAHTARLLKARAQAEGYVRALDPKVDPPVPFLIVVDIGATFDLYADFTGTNRYWSPFPAPNANRITLDQLADPAILARLKAVWTDPRSLDPSAKAQAVTRDAAARLAQLARELEAAKHPADTVAAFLMRLFFTMFAEDVGLLKQRSFTDLLIGLRAHPAHAHEVIAKLWGEMDVGGTSGVLHDRLLRFNGGLFEDRTALPLTADQLEQCIAAAELDWSPVEPAIFGTLLERALDSKERHKLGAHFTPRAYVERLVLATLVEPLRAEWAAVQEQVRKAIEKAGSDAEKRLEKRTVVTKGKQAAKADDLAGSAASLLTAFHRRLAGIRVLDPACGTGNFLYVALEHLKRLEGEVIALEAQVYGGSQERVGLLQLTVDPQNFLGLEINPRAARIAELVLWIGYLQWHRQTAPTGTWPEPVLHAYHTIENRDALIDYDRIEETGESRWDGASKKVHSVTNEYVPDESKRVGVKRYVNPRKAEWPKADYIVGNPPFLGTKRMRHVLGDGYVDAVRTVFAKSVEDNADFVMFWWDIAASLVRDGKAQRFGFITTNSITQAFNRRVIQVHLDQGLWLAWAIPDHPWVDSDDGASVRIAMTVAEADSETGSTANTHEGIKRIKVQARMGRIFSVVNEVEVGDGSHAVSLIEGGGSINSDLSIGADLTKVRELLANEGLCSNGIALHGQGFVLAPEEAREMAVHGEVVIKPYIGGRDLLGVRRELYVIDFSFLTEDQARKSNPAAFQRVIDSVKPERDQNNRAAIRDRWWRFAWERPVLMRALAGLPRYIATTETAKHRIFQFIQGIYLPDHMILVTATDDGFLLGVLSAKPHLVWTLGAGGTLEDRPRYNKSLCFDPFPFPVSNGAQRSVISDLAEQLDAHRKRQQAAHPTLTLTGMYNVLVKLRSGEALTAKEKVIHEQGLCSVLKDLHDRLDTAVAAAYGWPVDLSDDEILTRLVALNAERAREEAKGLVRWLRPEFQAPGAGGEQQMIDIGVTVKKGRKKKP